MDEKIFGDVAELVSRVDEQEDPEETARIGKLVEELDKEIASFRIAIDDAEAALDSAERELNRVLSELHS